MTEHAHRYRSEIRGRLQQVFEMTQPALCFTGEEAETRSKAAGGLPGVRQAATAPSNLQSAGRELPSALPACWARSSALVLPF